MNKTRVRLLTVAAVTTMAVSCAVMGAAAETVTETATEAGGENVLEGKKIGYSIPTATGNFETAELGAFEKEAEARGVELIVTDAGSDQQKQISDVEDLISQKCDAIIIYPVDGSGVAPAFEAVNNAGIPCFCMDNAYIDGKAGEDYITFVRSDQYDQGVTAANWVVDTFGDDEEFNILEITLAMGRSDAQNRFNGFQSVMDEHPNFKINSQDSNNDTAKAQSITQNVLQSSDIDIIYTHWDALGQAAILGVQQSGYTPTKDIAVITCDCTYEDMDSIKSGEGLTAAVSVPPTDGVPIIFNAINTYFQGGEVEDEYVIPCQIVNADNVDELYDEVGY